MNYDSLDVRINLLYDVVYNSNNSKHYTIKPIILDNISLEDIKKTNEFTETHEFEQILTDAKFEYKGFINNKWIFKRYSDSSHTSTLSIGKYDLSEIKNPNDLKRKELNNAMMHYILSEVVINDKFKHVILPLMMIDISLDNLSKSNVIYDVIRKKEENSDTKYYMFITEGYYKLSPLKIFLDKSYDKLNLLSWKVLIFQVLYTLYKISERLPGFRHNKLDLNSIRLYVRKEQNNKSNTTYHVGTNKFIIPDVGFDVKLTDFENASTNLINNKELKENPFYDIYYFLISLYLFIKSKKVNSNTKLVIDFIKNLIPISLIPDKSLNINNIINEQLIEQKMEQILSPIMILNKNNFFEQFISTMTLSPDPIDNKHINKDTLNKKYLGVNYYSATEDSSDMPRMLARKSNPKIEYRGKRKSIDLTNRKSHKFYGSEEDDEELDDIYSDDETENTEESSYRTEESSDRTEETSDETEERTTKRSILKRAEKRYKEISNSSDDTEFGKSRDSDNSESYFNKNDVKEMRKYLKESTSSTLTDTVHGSPRIKARKQTKSNRKQRRNVKESSSSINTEDLMKSIKRIQKPQNNNNVNHQATGSMPYNPMNYRMDSNSMMNPYMNQNTMMNNMNDMTPHLMQPTQQNGMMNNVMSPIMPNNMNMGMSNNIMNSLMPPVIPHNTMSNMGMGPLSETSHISETINFMSGGNRTHKPKYSFVKDNKEVKNKDFFFQPSQEDSVK